MIYLIAAIDEQYALGKQGKLLCHLPLDLKHFKKTTLHQSILMGRKTYDTIGRSLPERENFILTHQKDLQIPGCFCVNSLKEALEKKHSEILWVIGGGEIYSQCLPYAEKILLTKIHHTFENADTFFPKLDSKEWEITSEEFHASDEKNSYDFSFVTYQKIHSSES